MLSLLSPFAILAFISRRASANFCRSFQDSRHKNKWSGGSPVDESGNSFKDPAKLCLMQPLSEGRMKEDRSRLEDLDDGF